MQAPDTDSTQAPDIEIQPASPSGAAGPSSASILPPRPDPSFRNLSSTLPAGFGKATTPLQLVLTIMVGIDGSVSDVRVAQSSGQSVLDEVAAAFVKAKWRFRAATQNDKPVADWTTVLVRFAPIG